MRSCKSINIVHSSNIMRRGGGASGDGNARQDDALMQMGMKTLAMNAGTSTHRESTEFYSPGT